MIKLKFNINGKKKSIKTHSMARLLDVLREGLKLTGTKEGCGEGECGACSVFIDGVLVNSCLVPAIQAEGKKIKTIEGLSGVKKLNSIQDSFINHGGAQCGICTPGMVMATANLLEHAKNKKKISDDEIKTALAGNLCRCTGYMKIFDSVRSAINEKKP